MLLSQQSPPHIQQALEARHRQVQAQARFGRRNEPFLLGLCRMRWIWLVPGNLFALFLLVHIKSSGLGRSRLATQHVYHTSPKDVWYGSRDADGSVPEVKNGLRAPPDWSTSSGQGLNDVGALGLGRAESVTNENSASSGKWSGADGINAVTHEDDTDVEEQEGEEEDGDDEEESERDGDQWEEEEASEVEPMAHNAPIRQHKSMTEEGKATLERAHQALSSAATAPAIDFKALLDTYGSGPNPVAQVEPKMPKTFIDFRSHSACSYLCELLKSLGWRTSLNEYPATYPSLLLIKYTSYKKHRRVQRTIINQVGRRGSECIGGGKGKQLRCREKLAREHGCEYASLKVQPQQWNLQSPEQCAEFFDHVRVKNRFEETWIAKPGGSFHGDGIQVHHGVDNLSRQYGACHVPLRDGFIVQEVGSLCAVAFDDDTHRQSCFEDIVYIGKPILWGGHKFDFRSYLLIASTAPFLVFHHEGFVRKAELEYNAKSTDPKSVVTNSRSQKEEDHFFGFEELQRMITDDHGFPTDYLDTHFFPHALRISLYLFHTAKPALERRPGRHQLYGLDWMMDQAGKFHLLEANGGPAIRDYPDTGLTPRLWATLFELEELIHIEAGKIDGNMSVKERYRFQGWQLVYNELEEAIEEDQYDACLFNHYAQVNHPLYGFT